MGTSFIEEFCYLILLLFTACHNCHYCCIQEINKCIHGSVTSHLCNANVIEILHVLALVLNLWIVDHFC